MLAATAALFAACAETDLVNEVNIESNSQEIGFSTYAGKVTRATAENSTATSKLGLEQHHDNFKVWAYKNTADVYVFENVTVEHAGTKWTYSPLKYWDKAADNYEFYAASPADFNWVLRKNDKAQNDDYFVLQNFQLEDATIASTGYEESLASVTNQDLMIASPENVGQEDILAHNDVQLDFNHILSRLNVTVKRGENIDETLVVKLVSISVNKLPNTGTFTETEITNAGASTGRWDVWTDYTGKITGNALDVVTNKPSYVIQSLVMPQNVTYASIDRDGRDNGSTTAPYLYIEYTIDGEPFNASYNLANAFGSTADPVAFKEGWQNTLNITLDAYAIVFDAVTFKWVYDKDVNGPVID